ncbi:unnamed protein product [Acanthoscelides obtectus]|uniref:Uncharacterized protein n=1 Tax=Acanthoscelides obtectus TaxID=200917 RepID=A0A9P0L409_ACAOB|nr:unnamed protein product [Acanthoscelides obtectus]CAK1648848.1 hypothetical protein AOBTE_LOCUS15924 [Acanthoscelides obtectus]
MRSVVMCYPLFKIYIFVLQKSQSWASANHSTGSRTYLGDLKKFHAVYPGCKITTESEEPVNEERIAPSRLTLNFPRKLSSVHKIHSRTGNLNAFKSNCNDFVQSIVQFI